MPRGTQETAYGGFGLSPTGLSPPMVGRSRPLQLDLTPAIRIPADTLAAAPPTPMTQRLQAYMP